MHLPRQPLAPIVPFNPNLAPPQPTPEPELTPAEALTTRLELFAIFIILFFFIGIVFALVLLTEDVRRLWWRWRWRRSRGLGEAEGHVEMRLLGDGRGQWGLDEER